MQIHIRRFRDADAIKLSNVIRRAQRITLKNYYPKKIIAEFCKIYSPGHLRKKAQDRLLFVAEDKRNIAGVIGVKKNELKTFFVDPKYQGKGIGRKLFERYKKETIKHGYNRGFLHATPFAVPIYKKFGFKKIRNIKRKINGHAFYDVIMKIMFED